MLTRTHTCLDCEEKAREDKKNGLKPRKVCSNIGLVFIGARAGAGARRILNEWTLNLRGACGGMEAVTSSV